MDIEVNELWKSVLAEIEIEVSKANFLTLFKPTVLLSFEENVATIAAPSAMIIDLLKRRFYQIIKKSIDKATGKDVEVVFIPKTVLTILKDEKVGPLFTKVGQKPLKLPRVR